MTKTVAILLFEGVNVLDVGGPLEAFAAARDGDAPAYALVTWTLGAQTVRSEAGLTLCVDAVAPEGGQVDILIIPGGVGARAPQYLPLLADWLRRNHLGFGRIASICTGAYPLAESGLVDGRVVATHWAHAADLHRRYPSVAVRADALSSRDGRFHSSGGVTAGIDLALDLIEADYGGAAAMDVARELVVFLRRTGSQAQFSAPLKMQTQAPAELLDVCRWAAGHLDADLSVEALARRAHLSPRQFARRFQSAFGAPPAAYIKMLRLDAARAELAEGRATLQQIAGATGYGSADGFRRAFEQQFGITPGQYQRRFATGDTCA